MTKFRTILTPSPRFFRLTSITLFALLIVHLATMVITYRLIAPPSSATPGWTWTTPQKQISWDAPLWVLWLQYLPPFLFLLLLLLLWRKCLLQLTAILLAASLPLLIFLAIVTYSTHNTYGTLYARSAATTRHGWMITAESCRAGTALEIYFFHGVNPQPNESPLIRMTFIRTLIIPSFHDYPILYSRGPIHSISSTLIAYTGLGWVYSGDSAHGYALKLVVPYWLLIAICIAVPLIVFIRWHRTRRNHLTGLCPTCRYDLRAHSPGDLCPECGTPIPQK